MRNSFGKDSVLRYFVIVILFYLLFDWLLWDIQIAIQSPPIAGVLLGMIHHALLVASGILSIAFAAIKIKRSPVIALVPLLILVLVIFFQFSVEYTEWYARLNYNLLKNDREEVVQKFTEENLSQIGSVEYLLPTRFRLTSKTGCVYLNNNGKFNNFKEISFALRPGFQSSYIFFVKDDNELPKEIELTKIVAIRKLDEHWYWALVQ